MNIKKNLNLLNKKNKKLIFFLLVFIVFIFILIYLISLNNFIFNSNKNLNFKGNISNNFKIIKMYNSKNKHFLFYDLHEISNNVNFESLRIELKNKYFKNETKIFEKMNYSGFIINDNFKESFKNFFNKKNIQQENILKENQEKKIKYNNSLINQLFNISLKDPFYFYMNDKVKFSQSYYYISSQNSLFKDKLKSNLKLVRYIFIMNSSFVKDNDYNYYANKFVSKYNNLVMYNQFKTSKYYIFIIDFPEELFQRIFYDQGGLR